MRTIIFLSAIMITASQNSAYVRSHFIGLCIIAFVAAAWDILEIIYRKL